MKRIITHWTAGTYKANSLDKKHYHRIYEGDGKMVKGDFDISANSSKNGPLKSGKYAAHTARCNTDSIGVALACMAGAEYNKSFGKYPMTEVQFEAMCKDIASLCKQYNIPVTDRTVLSHAEVQPNLGIAQNGKWDYTVLPFKPELKGAKACGDYMRERVKFYMNPPVVKPTPAPTPAPTPTPTPTPVNESKTFFTLLIEFIKSILALLRK